MLYWLKATRRLNIGRSLSSYYRYQTTDALEALGRGIDRIKGVGVLLIITHRPEFEPPWAGRPYVTALTLNRLGPDDDRCESD